MCDSLQEHTCKAAAAIAPRLLAEDDLLVCGSDDDSDLEATAMVLEDAQEVEQQDEDQKLYLTQGFSTGCDAAMPEGGVAIHKVYKTAHRASDDGGAACGVATRSLTFNFSVDLDDLEGCKLCWRSGCAPWVRRQTDAAGSEPELPESSSDDDGFGDAKDNLLDNVWTQTTCRLALLQMMTRPHGKLTPSSFLYG